MKENKIFDCNDIYLLDIEAIDDFSTLKTPIIFLERYKIIEKIGEGGTSNVYKSLDFFDNNIVALKIIKKESKVISAKKRFELEGKTLMGFDNENILKIHDYFLCGPYSVIVMEYLKGKTLKNVIKENNFLSIEKSLNYFLKIISAIKEIHKQNIMHRDLKPHNIIIDPDDSLKLTDFGIVQASEDQDITQTNYIVGSIEYMAPEILKGNKATPKSEIYSLGIILYLMLTGSVPLKGIDFQDTAKKHLSETPESPMLINPNLDEKINYIVLKMIRTNDFERYQNVEELEAAILKYKKWFETKDSYQEPKKHKEHHQFNSLSRAASKFEISISFINWKIAIIAITSLILVVFLFIVFLLEI